ncbi:hypothetical protein Tco_1423438, partial [Tanacetum coccineum]
YTILDIASADVGMLDKLDRGLQTDVQHIEALSTTEAVEIWATKGLLDKAKGNVHGMEIIRDQSGNTLRASQSRFYNGKLVQTLLEGHSDLSLEGSLLGDCDVEKNDVGMLDKFDRGLPTDIQHMEALSTTEALRLVAGIATGALVKGCSRSEVPAQVKVASYRDRPSNSGASEDSSSLLHFPMSDVFTDPLKLLHLDKLSLKESVELEIKH